MVRKAVGYHRFDTQEELVPLNQIHVLLRVPTNFIASSQKLVDEHRVGAKMTRRYDTAATPYPRILADPQVTRKIKQQLTRQHKTLNPAQIRRDLTALESLLLRQVKAKHAPSGNARQDAFTHAGNHTWGNETRSGHLDATSRGPVARP